LQYAALRVEKVPEVYDEMAKRFGADDVLLGRLAAWYKTQKRFDDARATYRRYMNPSEGLNQVALSYREEQKPEEAVAIYRQLVGQDPERLVQHKSEIAATYRGVRKFKEAIDVYHELTKDDLANVGRWRWEIACTHRDAGQLAEAIGYFRQCDNLPENLKQMAWCHRQLKQPKEAVGLYSQIVAAYPDSAAWALLQSAYTREEAGEVEPAIKTFQSVCKRFPKDQHASIAHAHLQTKYKISVTLGGAKDE
jgi:tetratricopeptide (TPR) repeat protein